MKFERGNLFAHLCLEVNVNMAFNKRPCQISELASSYNIVEKDLNFVCADWQVYYNRWAFETENLSITYNHPVHFSFQSFLSFMLLIESFLCWGLSHIPRCQVVIIFRILLPKLLFGSRLRREDLGAISLDHLYNSSIESRIFVRKQMILKEGDVKFGHGFRDLWDHQYPNVCTWRALVTGALYKAVLWENP